jgi:hypothetical protein
MSPIAHPQRRGHGGAGRHRRRDAAPRGHAGFTARRAGRGHVRRRHRAQAARAARRVLFAECTNADAGYDAERLVDAFPGIEAEGALLDDLPERLERFHYDIVATTTFHADEAQASSPARARSWRCSSGPGTSSSSTRSPAAQGSRGRAGVRIGARRGQHPRDARDRRQRGVEIVSALIAAPDDSR